MKHTHWTWPATLGLLSDTALTDSVVLDNGDRLSRMGVQMMAPALEIATPTPTRSTAYYPRRADFQAGIQN